jgi:anaerobic selenocysteine-containing dehydrogenase
MEECKSKITRKNFIKTAAAVTAATTLGSAFKPTLRAFAQTENSKQAESEGQWKAATCQGCTSWCSVQVLVVDGRAIKVRGNPNSKVNRGNCCARCHLSVQQVYDPDRVKTPMKRTNPQKGRNENPKFVPISWDEALETIADRQDHGTA